VLIERAARVAWKRGHLCVTTLEGLKCARCRLTGTIDVDGTGTGLLFQRDCGKPTGVSAC
jgi:hypothetical protein